MNKEDELIQKAREAVRKYIEDVIYGIRNNKSIEIYMDCPKCGTVHSLNPGHGFRCCWDDCRYVLPEELVPLIPAGLQKYYDESMYNKYREKKLAFMRSLFKEGEFDKLFE